MSRRAAFHGMVGFEVILGSSAESEELWH